MKNTRLRHAEYYGMTRNIVDAFLQSLKKIKKLTNLMSIITSEDNILLAFIAILSETMGVQRLEKIKLQSMILKSFSPEEFIEIVKEKIELF